MKNIKCILGCLTKPFPHSRFLILKGGERKREANESKSFGHGLWTTGQEQGRTSKKEKKSYKRKHESKTLQKLSPASISAVKGEHPIFIRCPFYSWRDSKKVVMDLFHAKTQALSWKNLGSWLGLSPSRFDCFFQNTIFELPLTIVHDRQGLFEGGTKMVICSPWGDLPATSLSAFKLHFYAMWCDATGWMCLTGYSDAGFNLCIFTGIFKCDVIYLMFFDLF